ncbi:Ras-specific guanine nucleotide-releasing factor [Takifugu flavidus]|uniref:Ras-specific guanine nucleotide-releasing factor n=1 Tax=Takifugu flavidus TaxID=433684 RepID=A0A5C6NGW3_9TELE|nr:Ras-specific guanine nucleotide-releasing factor [Takifugu flavidus]
MFQYGMAASRSATFPIEKPRHLLDDSFLESQSPVRHDPHTTFASNGLSLGSSESSFGEELSPVMERGRMYATLGPNWRVPHPNSPRNHAYAYRYNQGSLLAQSPSCLAAQFPSCQLTRETTYLLPSCAFSGVLMLRSSDSSNLLTAAAAAAAAVAAAGVADAAVAAAGVADAAAVAAAAVAAAAAATVAAAALAAAGLSSWTRFWISLSGSTLTFYGAKALRASERKHYKSSPCKKVCVTGWMVLLPDDPSRLNVFQLSNPDKGDVYKFQTGSRFSAIIWHKKLEEACRGSRPKVRARPSLLVLLMAPSWVLMAPNAPIKHSIGTCS